MKKLFSLCATLLMIITLSNAFIPARNGDNPEEIELKNQQNREEPTSFNHCYIHAYKTDFQVIIYFSNYSWNASAVVSGLGGFAVSGQQSIVGTGYVYIDISSLPAGMYSLTVFADSLYSGTFNK